MHEHEQRILALIEFTKTNSDIEPYGSAIYDETGQLLISVIADKASPINHAEILAINACAKQYPKIQWNTLTLYTTGEPCCMCAAACCWANLKAVVYATDIPFMQTLWNIESPLRAIDIMKSHPKCPELIEHVCINTSNQLFVARQAAFAKACQEYRWI